MEQLGLTVPEAVERSRIGRDELYRAIKAGELKVVRIGRRIVVPVESLKRWLEERASVTA